MEIVYLGLLSTIFNAIFDAILSPVFKFLSSLLETVLGWLFDNILGPLLESVLWPIIESTLDLIFEIFAKIFYSILVSLLQIVDAMQNAFNIFAGIQSVTYRSYELPLIEMLFRVDTIQWAVLIITILGFCLTFVFAVLATARSMMELDSDNPRPVSKVLRATFQAMLRFALIPICCLFLITMSGRVLEGVNMALGGGESTFSRMIFVVASLDASKSAEFNISGTAKDGDTPVTPSTSIGINDSYRRPFYTGEKSYANLDQVESSFNFARFDYRVGYGASLFMLIIMAICLVNFICRIFEVLLLFIASPLFVSAMPLDDGEKFKAWQDMFVAKVFSGFGSVIAMEIYMLLCPVVMGGGISFVQSSTPEADYLIRLIFLLGGAWAVIKAGPTITQLLNYQAGAAEHEAANSVTSGIHDAVRLTGQLGSRVAGGIAGGIGKYRMERRNAREASDNRIAETLNRGSRAGGMSPKSKPLIGNKPGAGGSGAGGKKPGAGGSGAGGRKPGAGGSGAGARSQFKPGIKPAGAPKSSVSLASQRAKAASPGIKGAKAGAGVSRAALLGTLGSKGRITLNRTKGGTRYLGANFGKALTFGRDANNNFHARVLGVGYREGANGAADKISLPFVRLKRGDDGGFHVSKVKIGSALRFKRAETVTQNPDGTVSRQFGSMYCSDLKLGASLLKRRFDQDTGRVETLQKGFDYYGKNQDGEYVRTKREGFGFRAEYERTESGEYRKTHVDTWTTSSALSYDEEGRRHVDSTVTYGAFAPGEDGAFHPERHTVYQSYQPEEARTIDVSSGSERQTPPPAPSSPPEPAQERREEPPAQERREEPPAQERREEPPAQERGQEPAEQQPAEERGTEERPRESESHGEGEDR